MLLQGQRHSHKPFCFPKEGRNPPVLAPASAASVRAASSAQAGAVQAPLPPCPAPHSCTSSLVSHRRTDNSSLALTCLESEMVAGSFSKSQSTVIHGPAVSINSKEFYPQIKYFVLHSSIRSFFVSTKHTGLTEQCLRSYQYP